tara:strand:+ start:366 stop:527 length:162 start_codon:yes stop_codon:yes gene_type:complete
MLELFANEINDRLIGDEDMGDGTVVTTEDGCDVEADNECEHGKESPMLRLGLI